MAPAEVEEVRRLLHRVGPLDDHDPGGAVLDRPVGDPCHLEHVREGQVGAADLEQVERLDLEVVRHRDTREQLGARRAAATRPARARPVIPMVPPRKITCTRVGMGARLAVAGQTSGTKR